MPDRVERREDLVSRLAVLENDVHTAHSRLFGNGQPGEISKLRLEIELAAGELKQDMDKRFEDATSARYDQYRELTAQNVAQTKQLNALQRLVWIGLGIIMGLNLLSSYPQVARLLTGR